MDKHQSIYAGGLEHPQSHDCGDGDSGRADIPGPRSPGSAKIEADEARGCLPGPSNTSFSSNNMNSHQKYVSMGEAFAGSSVFITGATGYIGSVILEQLLRRHPDVKKVRLTRSYLFRRRVYHSPSLVMASLVLPLSCLLCI